MSTPLIIVTVVSCWSAFCDPRCRRRQKTIFYCLFKKLFMDGIYLLASLLVLISVRCSSLTQHGMRLMSNMKTYLNKININSADETRKMILARPARDTIRGFIFVREVCGKIMIHRCSLVQWLLLLLFVFTSVINNRKRFHLSIAMKFLFC